MEEMSAPRIEPRVCLLIPVLNESGNLPSLWDRLCSRIGLPFRVCFVDDGSVDGTREWLMSLAAQEPDRVNVILRTKRSRGSQRGSALLAALRWGLSIHDHTWFVEMDGDLSHRPEEIEMGLDMLRSGSAEVAIASKYVAGSQVTNRSFGRRAVSAVCNVAVRLLITRRITDFSNGFRFYVRSAGEAIDRAVVHYGSPIFLSEALAIWLAGGFRIREFPTVYVGRFEGLSKLRAGDLVKAAIAVFEISLRYHVLGFQSPRRLPHTSLDPLPVPRTSDKDR